MEDISTHSPSSEPDIACQISHARYRMRNLAHPNAKSGSDEDQCNKMSDFTFKKIIMGTLASTILKSG